MRTRLIWTVTVAHDPDTIVNAFEVYLREGLRTLAFSLEILSGSAEPLEPEMQLLKRHAFPISATADSPELDPAEHQYEFMETRGQHFTVALFDAGRIDIKRLGNRSVIEVYSYDAAATAHLFPIIILIRVVVAYVAASESLGEPKRLRTDLPPSAPELGHDLPDSPGQIMAVYLLESLLKLLGEWDGDGFYQDMMEDRGLNKVTAMTLAELGLQQGRGSGLLSSRNVRLAVRAIGAVALLLSVIWFVAQPGFEPAVTALGGLAALIASFLVGDST